VREFSALASNWRSHESAHQYLERHNVPVIWDIDTRALVLHLRQVGALRGVLSTDETSVEQLIAETRALPTMAGQELASRVTTKSKYDWSQNSIELAHPLAAAAGAAASVTPTVKGNGRGPSSSGHGLSHTEKVGGSAAPSAGASSLGGRSFSSDISIASKSRALAPEGRRYRVVAYDFGIKQNILRLLVDHGCNVTVVPAKTSADDVLAMKPDGVFLSNGPGDPEPMTYAIANIRKLVGRAPVFGICLGHQLCGLALGGKTFKLKFGHHGSNHPVKNLLTGKVEITSQNHGFCVDPDSLPANDVEVTHLNLNDHTNEGLRHRSQPLFSVQYHPEASPGPHDARYLFNDFIKLMNENPR
jgi:carbamoyl-phosphate synthase small subunit